MAKDFAKQFRTDSKEKAKSDVTKSSARSVKTDDLKNRLHIPSFCGGLLAGAVIVGITLHLEDFSKQKAPPISVKTINEEKPIIFQFDEKLRGESIQADAETYTLPKNLESSSKIEYLIQSGAYSNEVDANAARATLTLMGFDVFIRVAKLEEKLLFRVFIGPFPSQLQAGRALTKLREQGIIAFIMTRDLEN